MKTWLREIGLFSPSAPASQVQEGYGALGTGDLFLTAEDMESLEQFEEALPNARTALRDDRGKNWAQAAAEIAPEPYERFLLHISGFGRTA